MGLPLVERSLYYLVMGRADGTLAEEAAAEGLDELKVATGLESLQLLYMRSDHRADSC